MTPYLTLVLAGAAFGVALTPLVRTASSALGLVDAPGGRKVHLASVPRLGGIAVAAAATLALVALPVLVPGLAAPPMESITSLEPILLGGALVFAIGVVDDIATLSAWPKLVVQFIAAAIVIQSDLRIERVTMLGQTWQLGLWSWPVTAAWIVGLTNAFNLIDGLDGLAAGVAVIAATTCATILVWRGHSAEALLLAALLGAALGFLVYNSSPASIFLGDGGSLLFGFVLATTAITGWQKGATALAAGVPILMFGLPIADALSTVVRRLFASGGGHPLSVSALLARIVKPDRQHIHHRLVALGLSTRGTVVLLYVVTGMLSAIALATAKVD